MKNISYWLSVWFPNGYIIIWPSLLPSTVISSIGWLWCNIIFDIWCPHNFIIRCCMVSILCCHLVTVLIKHPFLFLFISRLSIGKTWYTNWRTCWYNNKGDLLSMYWFDTYFIHKHYFPHWYFETINLWPFVDV